VFGASRFSAGKRPQATEIGHVALHDVIHGRLPHNTTVDKIERRGYLG